MIMRKLFVWKVWIFNFFCIFLKVNWQFTFSSRSTIGTIGGGERGVLQIRYKVWPQIFSTMLTNSLPCTFPTMVTRMHLELFTTSPYTLRTAQNVQRGAQRCCQVHKDPYASLGLCDVCRHLHERWDESTMKEVPHKHFREFFEWLGIREYLCA